MKWIFLDSGRNYFVPVGALLARMGQQKRTEPDGKMTSDVMVS